MDTFLIADIGATHARFAHYEPVKASAGERLGAIVGEKVVLPTGEYGSATDLVVDALDALGGPTCTGGCFAVAGPVGGGEVQITNGGLRFEEAALAAAHGFDIRLINDFYAVAMAVPSLQRLERIGGRDTSGEEAGVMAVLGPGSGLGMGVLVPRGEQGWQVLSSEGGHSDLAPGNHLEQEVLGILQAQHGSVCWETVVSGPGLVNLYEAVSMMWGSKPRDLSPEDVSRQGIDADDPVCHQTLELFFGFLGAAAGNLALTVCARSGVFIGGGIVPALRDFAVTSPLRRRFDERAGLTDYVADIPLYLILDEDPGLLGAGICLTRFEESTHGR
jgi:glucokinase